MKKGSNPKREERRRGRKEGKNKGRKGGREEGEKGGRDIKEGLVGLLMGQLRLGRWLKEGTKEGGEEGREEGGKGGREEGGRMRNLD
jgi:hypothetical protein